MQVIHRKKSRDEKLIWLEIPTWKIKMLLLHLNVVSSNSMRCQHEKLTREISKLERYLGGRPQRGRLLRTEISVWKVITV